MSTTRRKTVSSCPFFYFLSFFSIPVFPPSYCLCLSLRSFILNILLSAFKCSSSCRLRSSLLFLLLRKQKAVTTERLYLKEVAEPSFTQPFSDLCCQFVSVNLWESCLCVCLSLARCAGCEPRQGLKPQTPFPIIHIAIIIVVFDVFSTLELKV